MRGLHDYLDHDIIRITTKDGEFEGTPIVVNYSDETRSGEDEITIENDNLYGFRESEIISVEIVK